MKKIVYEGYAPHGVAILVENRYGQNTNRTVAKRAQLFHKNITVRWVKNRGRWILFLPVNLFLTLCPATMTWKNWNLN